MGLAATLRGDHRGEDALLSGHTLGGGLAFSGRAGNCGLIAAAAGREMD